MCVSFHAQLALMSHALVHNQSTLVKPIIYAQLVKALYLLYMQELYVLQLCDALSGVAGLLQHALVALYRSVCSMNICRSMYVLMGGGEKRDMEGGGGKLQSLYTICPN